MVAFSDIRSRSCVHPEGPGTQRQRLRIRQQDAAEVVQEQKHSVHPHPPVPQGPPQKGSARNGSPTLTYLRVIWRVVVPYRSAGYVRPRGCRLSAELKHGCGKHPRCGAADGGQKPRPAQGHDLPLGQGLTVLCRRFSRRSRESSNPWTAGVPRRRCGTRCSSTSRFTRPHVFDA